MTSANEQYGRISALHLKPSHGLPMLRVPYLDLDPRQGILADINSGRSPRQLCVADLGSLREHHVKPTSSRANVIISSPAPLLSTGARLTIGSIRLRITFPCEPCSHGAHMAEAPMRDFRAIERYLAISLGSGRIWEGDSVTTESSAYPDVPTSFAERCAWALDFLPAGNVVSSPDFLDTIGAGLPYARTLPRWMFLARQQDKPTHRVLNSKLRPPSWAPQAEQQLLTEGLAPPSYAAAQYPLMDLLWFAHLPAP
jgi:alkylated DNA nucleotide flippase Atl1